MLASNAPATKVGLTAAFANFVSHVAVAFFVAVFVANLLALLVAAFLASPLVPTLATVLIAVGAAAESIIGAAINKDAVAAMPAAVAALLSVPKTFCLLAAPSSALGAKKLSFLSSVTPDGEMGGKPISDVTEFVGELGNCAFAASLSNVSLALTGGFWVGS